MKCPKCGYEDCKIVAQTEHSGGDYSLCDGICGTLLLGPLGSLCGWSDDRETTVDAYWVCKRCGYKFKS